jgi:hypothetical protein
MASWAQSAPRAARLGELAGRGAARRVVVEGEHEPLSGAGEPLGEVVVADGGAEQRGGRVTGAQRGQGVEGAFGDDQVSAGRRGCAGGWLVEGDPWLGGTRSAVFHQRLTTGRRCRDSV